VIHLKDYKLTDHLLFVVGYFILSVVFTLLDTSMLSIWLGINVILAAIPYLLITYIQKRQDEKEVQIDYINILLFVVFVFFLPNAFYVITDFIHISGLEFYNDIEYGVRIYEEVIEQYVLLVHILFSALIGIYYGAKSLLKVEQVLKNHLSSKGLNIMIFILIFLSSIGIYIGRFLRLFSWDILNPFNVLELFFNEFNIFGLWFIILFTVIQYVFFFIFKLMLPEEPIK
jgi:uncharacterized membrane protein